MSLAFSIIIATRNRAEVLAQSLTSYLHQTFPVSEYEIIVINDGSTDHTREVVKSFSAGSSNILYCEQEKRGPATARNVGITKAKGKYLFFTGDDIIATGNLLKTHYEALASGRDVAVLGYTPWDPKLKATKFMEFLLREGYQFSYSKLKHKAHAPWYLFYASNISLERKWFTNDLFDASFPYPAWEDCELGFRLTRKGLKIVFNRQALAYHYHCISEEDFYTKTRQAGFSRVYLYQKHPQLMTAKFKCIQSRAAYFVLKGLYKCCNILTFLKLDALRWKIAIWYFAAQGIREGIAASTHGIHTKGEITCCCR